MNLLCITAFLLISQVTSQTSDNYDGHQVLKIFPKNDVEAKFVLNLVEKYGLDIWHAHQEDSSLDVRIFPEVIEAVTQQLKIFNIPFSTWIHNVQTLIDKQFDRNSSRVHERATSRSFDFTRYYTFTEIINTLASLETVDGVGPSGSSIFSEHSQIGSTIEGRPLQLVKIYKPSATKKRAIFVDGGIHAREWISPAFMLYLFDQLKYNPSRAANIEDLVTIYDWYLLPVLNPDGYSYSHTSSRLWRKNRRTNPTDGCHGVDLNRNFGYEWNPAIGGSTSHCSDVYSGSGPFSELESQAVRNFLTNGIDFISYLTVHSYGQYWLYPWGYTTALPADVAELDAAAGVAINAIRARYNTRYTKGSSTNTLYAAAGGSDDYAKGGAGVKYSYTLELRDTGRFGFVLPESQILETCLETMDGFIAYVNFLKTAPQRG